MIRAARMMLTCHWSARRIQRYLDADPAAPLHTDEIRRLEAHLAVCEKCRASELEFRQINAALSRWTVDTMPDQDSIEHVRHFLDRLTGEST
ncbi:zf-HC2 domain-containing protein [Rhodococcus sp. IEGM 1318]|uniref:zf-HC2 domain-containing protein n=1 Tax=Rhodococcus sp. IEGM 1318 TaxID=3082226 RepID=UPI0029530FBC|nr:zf-HC2 domain-containing protein [Rhodococcus sp. IEGM 1318]MDV8009179.1 zf-HC2 domain-containing protein [Rhodococcus sp. IEGM 1318]